MPINDLQGLAAHLPRTNLEIIDQRYLLSASNIQLSKVICFVALLIRLLNHLQSRQQQQHYYLMHLK